MYTIDVTKHELSKAINQRQRNLNINNQYQHKQNRDDLLAAKTLKRGRNSTQHKVCINKNLADIQKEQMELKKIDAANDLIKSRIQDEQNLLKIHERFPYGKQNVGISEDVLERYKGNYHEQSRILEKFRMEAELLKKTSRVKSNNSQPFNQWCLRQPTDNRKKQLELKRMRQTMQQQLQQERALRELEKKQMRNIADTLSGLSLQLHNNSYTLEKGIRDMQNRLKNAEKRRSQPTRPKHTYKDILDIETSSKRIPVVVYKDQPYDARLYFSDFYKSTEKIPKETKSSTQREEEYKIILNVLHENNRRLRYLDKISGIQNLHSS